MKNNYSQNDVSAEGFRLNRRQFLGGLGALTLAVGFNGRIALAAENSPEASEFVPNAFIRIDKDGFVTVISSYLEMGQGTFTGLATLAAEELDITPEQLKVVGSPADVEKYVNPVLAAGGFKVQGTGGSTAMAGAWTTMRKAAASARAMLLQAAANAWKVPVMELQVKNGVISHSSGKQAGYGEFVDKASTLSLPADDELTLKDKSAYTRVGKADGMMRVDIPDKVNGKAIFTQDIKLPGMLVAVIAHPPRKFAKVASVDKTATMKIPGVEAVLKIPGDDNIQGGVAVLAKNTWIAKKGRDALTITWDESTGSRDDSEALFTEYKKLAATPGLEVGNKGQQVEEAPDGGKVIEAVFELPYLAHSPMEPMNALVEITDDGAHLWNGEQWHTADQAAMAKELGLPPEKVTVTQLYAGGSFGRRACPMSDYIVEATRIAKIAKQNGVTGPVKLVWMREEDVGGLFYRPMTVHNNRIVLNADGSVASWRWRVVGQSFFPTPEDQVDSGLMEGTHELPYAIDNMLVEQHLYQGDIPVSWLRSVGHTHTALVGEVLIDEIAAFSGKDPYKYRRELLAEHPRFLEVLDLVAEKANWNSPLPQAKNGERRARGIAIRESFGTVVAQVAEVTVRADNTYKVDKVYCAVDCGQVINPVNIASQVEGGVGFGMSFLRQQITLKDGVVQQTNFNNYPVLRINEAPVVETFMVDSSNPPTGIGEPGVPPAVPAVLNAISAITGKFIRRMPLGAHVQA